MAKTRTILCNQVIPEDLKYKADPYPSPTCTTKWFDVFDRNFKKLEAIDEEAKKRGLILGRYVSQPVADGRAYYQIVGETTRKYIIQWLEGFPDDYVDNRWGYQASVSKSEIHKMLSWHDTLNSFFKKKGE